MKVKKHTFSPILANRYNVGGAIVLDNIAYFIKDNIRHGKPPIDGEYWCEKSINEFANLLPYYSFNQCRRIIEKLEKSGAVLSKKLKKKRHDQTKHYTLKCPLVKKIYMSNLPNPELAKRLVPEEAKIPSDKVSISYSNSFSKQVE